MSEIEKAIEGARIIPEYVKYFNQEAEFIKDFLYGKVIDVGCGQGRIIPYIHDRIEEYWGVDNDKKMIDNARKNLSKYHKAKFKALDAKRLSKYFTVYEFDFSVCLWNTLHVIAGEDYMLSQMSEITKDKIIVTLALKDKKTFNIRKKYYQNIGVDHRVDESTQTIFSEIWGPSKAYNIPDLEKMAYDSGLTLSESGKIGELGIYGIFKR